MFGFVFNVGSYCEGGGTALKPALCVGASVRWLGSLLARVQAVRGTPPFFPRRHLEIELSLVFDAVCCLSRISVHSCASEKVRLPFSLAVPKGGWVGTNVF